MEKTTHGMRNMTEGSPAGHIFAFTLPLLLGSFLQQLYNMVDSWVVGNYVGDAALAAVGVGFPVIFMFTSLFIGISTGGTVVIAQFFGAGQMERVRDAVDTIYTTFVRFVLPMTVAALLLVKPILLVMRVDSEFYHEAWVYLMIVCAGLVGTIGYNMNAGILNGLGNSGTTLLFLSIAAGMNIVLDLVLVLTFHWGVMGVAVGTVASQAFSWLFGVFYINRHYPEIAIHPFNGRFDRELFRQIMKIGLPAGIQMSLVSIGTMVVTSKVDTYGKSFAAGFNVGNKLDTMAFLPAQSLANAVTAFVGQNVGAHKGDRVRQGIRITVIASVVWTLLTTVVLMAFSAELVGVFSPKAEVIAAGSVYLKCIMPCYTGFTVMFCLNNAMRGAGDSMFPMVSVLLSLILIRVPAVYLLANLLGSDYMYYGYAIGWIVGLLMSLVHYFSGRWKRYGALTEEKIPENVESSCNDRINGL
jgi:putative MATE family efflux protein